jgi:hypothetical protein
LDSLVRIEHFQWLTLDFRGTKILMPFCRRARTAGMGVHDFGLRKGTDWSWGKRNQISAFLQEIAVRAVSFWPPPSTSNSLKRALLSVIA